MSNSILAKLHCALKNELIWHLKDKFAIKPSVSRDDVNGQTTVVQVLNLVELNRFKGKLRTVAYVSLKQSCLWKSANWEVNTREKDCVHI